MFGEPILHALFIAGCLIPLSAAALLLLFRLVPPRAREHPLLAPACAAVWLLTIAAWGIYAWAALWIGLP